MKAPSSPTSCPGRSSTPSRAPVPLGAGDSVHFDATKTHCLANVGSDVAEVLTITTMGLFDDHPTP